MEAHRTQTPLSRRRALALTGAAVVGGVVTACAPAAGAVTGDRDLAGEVGTFTDALTAAGPYRPPTPAERDAVVPALRALAASGDDGDARATLTDHGFAVYTATSGHGSRYVVAASDSRTERAWGLYAFPLGRSVSVLAEVPHPNFDLQTEKVGLDLIGDVPGAALVEAGAHRRAADSLADVAHQTSSLFHAFVTDVAVRSRVPQVQLHGFDDAHGPDEDVVLSPGAAPVSTPLRDASAALRRDGRRVCQAWTDDCPNLEGHTNVQSAAVASSGVPFLHVEMSDDVRRDRDTRGAVASALAGAVGTPR